MALTRTLVAGVFATALLCVFAQDTKLDYEGIETLQLHGSGTTNPSKLLWKAMSILEERAKIPIRMTYRAVGSGTGQKEFKGNEFSNNTAYHDFGSGDIPFSKADYDFINANQGEFYQLPFLMGAITFFHSVPVDKLQLNACLLAKIFNRQITKWDHPEIMSFADNQIHALAFSNKEIKVVRRTYGSSSTSLSTGYIKKAVQDDSNCPNSVWPDNMVGKGDADPADPSTPTKAPFWKSDTIAVQGSDGVADYLLENEYAIGYLDMGHGKSRGLKEIYLQNKDGNFVVSTKKDGANLAGAFENTNTIPDEMDGDWSQTDLINQPGEKTWPIMTFSYIYVKKDITSLGKAGGLLKALLHFLLRSEGQGLLPEFGFIRIPASLEAKALAAADSLDAADGITWQFEDASATLPYQGASPYFFSGKRRSYNSYLLDHVTDDVEGTLEGLADRVTSIEDTMAAATTTGPNGESASHTHSHDDDDDDDKTSPVAIVALIIAIIALVVQVVVFLVVIGGLKAKIASLEKSQNVYSGEKNADGTAIIASSDA
eukprot:m.332808 g.332808  ORF g.332808 m.332808 type:complete len:543 (-) comp17010_c0_seq1:128-1756(-)